ncbi:MAG: hypothetical protein ACOYVK_14165 [Bacillota bacterium]
MKKVIHSKHRIKDYLIYPPYGMIIGHSLLEGNIMNIFLLLPVILYHYILVKYVFSRMVITDEYIEVNKGNLHLPWKDIRRFTILETDDNYNVATARFIRYQFTIETNESIYENYFYLGKMDSVPIFELIKKTCEANSVEYIEQSEMTRRKMYDSLSLSSNHLTAKDTKSERMWIIEKSILFGTSSESMERWDAICGFWRSIGFNHRGRRCNNFESSCDLLATNLVSLSCK